MQGKVRNRNLSNADKICVAFYHDQLSKRHKINRVIDRGTSSDSFALLSGLAKARNLSLAQVELPLLSIHTGESEAGFELRLKIAKNF